MQTAQGRYTQLEQSRQPFLMRAREAATLTIPSLMPPEGHTGFTRLPTPFQGIGARGLNNLAAKLLLALLPPNSPFFRFQIDDYTLEKLTRREGMRGEVDKALNRAERAIMTEIEANAIRVPSAEAMKQLAMAGNVLIYLPAIGGMKVFRLDRYVVSRDPMGNVLEIIIKESVAPSALPENIRNALPKERSALASKTVEKTLDLFTWVRREGDRWTVHQEIKGLILPDSRGSYPLEKCPFIPLRWSKIDGEDYGRGHVEEYLGDLISLESLTKSIVEGSAAAAKVLFLVKPNGTTQLRTLTQSKSGDVRAGNADDVTVLQLDKYADFKVAFEAVTMINQRLSMAFMLNSSIQRNGERVTAEEIRYMAGELEDALGGVYSILSQEFQLPLVRCLMFQMERQRRLPPLPPVVRPTITTGLDALGRGHDLQKLDMLIAGIGQTFGPEAVAQTFNLGEYVTRRGTALGIDMSGLVKSAQQQQADQMQAAMQMLVEKLGPKGMDIVRDQMKPEAQANAT